MVESLQGILEMTGLELMLMVQHHFLIPELMNLKIRLL
jgi:hypothetical protein